MDVEVFCYNLYINSHTECYIFMSMYSVLYRGFLHCLSVLVVSAEEKQMAELYIFTCQCLLPPRFIQINL
jgi:hypothetical protein